MTLPIPTLGCEEDLLIWQFMFASKEPLESGLSLARSQLFMLSINLKMSFYDIIISPAIEKTLILTAKLLKFGFVERYRYWLAGGYIHRLTPDQWFHPKLAEIYLSWIWSSTLLCRTENAVPFWVAVRNPPLQSVLYFGVSFFLVQT